MNNDRQLYIVITTINGITKGIAGFSEIVGKKCVIVGDRKTPPEEEFSRCKLTVLPYDGQQELGFKVAKYLPDNHYCRKNLGYLFSAKKGAKILADTDDDNIPYEGWVGGYTLGSINGINLVSGPRIVNVYKYFSEEKIWPRGIPLNAIENDPVINDGLNGGADILIYQGLADKSPDVDAIHRLIFSGKEYYFDKIKPPIVLDEGVYCPFNSQNTIWSIRALTYMYLPMFVSFRFTDILRGYVAQKGLWAMGGRLAYGTASVYQERNYHDLMKDFNDEIVCYTEIEKILEVLDSCDLTGKPTDDIRVMYKKLMRLNVVKSEELDALDAWCADVSSMGL